MNIRELKEKYPKWFEKEYLKWRGHEPYDDWWGSVYEMSKDDGEDLGFDIDDIIFNGFSSQGDGASWAGDVDIKKWIEANKRLEDPPYYILWALINDGLLNTSLNIYRNGSNYAHENAMRSGDLEMWLADENIITGAFTGANAGQLAESMGGEDFLLKVQDEILESAKDFARDIYENLEKEHDYLTSEDYFIEECEANDVDFDEEEN